MKFPNSSGVTFAITFDSVTADLRRFPGGLDPVPVQRQLSSTATGSPVEEAGGDFSSDQPSKNVNAGAWSALSSSGGQSPFAPVCPVNLVFPTANGVCLAKPSYPTRVPTFANVTLAARAPSPQRPDSAMSGAVLRPFRTSIVTPNWKLSDGSESERPVAFVKKIRRQNGCRDQRVTDTTC